jgi:hypothetical protein
MGNDPRARQFQIAGFCMQLIAQQGDERRLAAAVGTDQTDLPARMQLQAGFLDQRLAVAGEGEIT